MAGGIENKIYLIGNSSEYNDYLDNKSIEKLPLKNLPVVYFPFYYDSNENVKDNLKKFTNIIYSNTSCKKDKELKEGDIFCNNTNELFNKISILEEEWQPYNKNNIKIISGIIISLWIIILFITLKVIHYYFSYNYTNIILISTIILLFIGIIYSFVFTSKNF